MVESHFFNCHILQSHVRLSELPKVFLLYLLQNGIVPLIVWAWVVWPLIVRLCVSNNTLYSTVVNASIILLFSDERYYLNMIFRGVYLLRMIIPFGDNNKKQEDNLMTIFLQF